MKATPLDRAAALRRKDLAKIHVLANKQLGLDEGTYRALLQRVTGKSSAAVLDARARQAVIRELVRLAGDGERSMRNSTTLSDAPLNVREEVAAMVGKVGAILADAKRSWAYAHGLAQRMFHVARVEWLRADQLHRLIAALAIDQKRRHAREGTE